MTHKTRANLPYIISQRGTGPPNPKVGSTSKGNPQAHAADTHGKELSMGWPMIFLTMKSGDPFIAEMKVMLL